MINTITEDAALLKRFKDKAADMELKAVDFLDKNGNIPYLKAHYTAIRCIFHDGVAITLPRRLLEKYFNKQVFKLRPSRDNA